MVKSTIEQSLVKHLLAASLFLGAPAAAWSQVGPDWVDRVQRERAETPDPGTDLYGILGARVWYDHFARRDPHDREDEFIYQGLLDAAGRITTDAVDAGLWTLLNYNVHSEESDRSDDEERLYGSLQWELGTTTLTLVDLFQNEVDSDDMLFPDRVDRLRNDVFARVDQGFSERLGAAAQGVHRLTDFDSSELDHADNRITGGSLIGYYEYSDRARGVIEGEYSRIDYEESAQQDSDGFTVRTGVRGEISDRLRGAITGGYFWRRAEEDPATGDEESVSGLDLFVDATYAFSDRTSAGLRAVRTTTYAQQGDFQLVTLLRAEASHDLAEEVTARLSASYHRGSVLGGDDTEQTAARLLVSWRLGEAVSLEGSWKVRSVVRQEGPDDVENLVYFGISYRL